MYNIPTRVNFDGDWNVQNNEATYDALLKTHPEIIQTPGKFPQYGVADIYYEAISSKTHVFLTYYLFYPHDASAGCTATTISSDGKHLDGHLNDASSLMLIVRKQGTNEKPDGKLEWVITQDHGDITNTPGPNVKTDGQRPVVQIDNANHYMNTLPSSAALPGKSTHYIFGKTDDYRLVAIYKNLWPQRKNPTVFGAFNEHGVGVQFMDETEPKPSARGTPPWAPWAREFNKTNLLKWGLQYALGGRGIAASFFDPIQALIGLYIDVENYSRDYVYHPYGTANPSE